MRPVHHFAKGHYVRVASYGSSFAGREGTVRDLRSSGRRRTRFTVGVRLEGEEGIVWFDPVELCYLGEMIEGTLVAK